ncbi:MAG: carboxylating nicotinate-nucleotide diphosphorylase [Myxococcales bacterium]|nr:carboxylating nicotinate-nucleotide diphosphorylase [Myxococcales bacterium]
MKLAHLVQLSLGEDVGPGDVTTEATVPVGGVGRARVYAKEGLVVCGHEPAAEVFRQLGATWEVVVRDGQRAVPGQTIGHAAGPLRALITGERVALNFLMRLSGIATHTAATVAMFSGPSGAALRVLDTRKTTPLHRSLEKHAVRCGGAFNHRGALYDGVLIKDNHVVAAGGVTAAIHSARAAAHHLLKIECEVESIDELREALAAGADAILLDNMDDEAVVAAIIINQETPRTSGPAWIEASGNMTGPRIAGLRVLLESRGLRLDAVSMGGLIHQARWADLSMRVEAAPA